jgi:medium-chain acyl-[acyl-carrier-protein] hydrolase
MSDPWVETRASGAESVRLFTFPFAGGSAQIYRGWDCDLPASIGLYAVQLPGRGSRVAEPAFTSMEALMPVLAKALARYLDRPFAFFGHSLGAIIAYEAARQLRSQRGESAVHLFVSARRAPSMRSRREPTHLLDDEAFIARLRELNGTPVEVLREPELMALLLPMLRADFHLSESYVSLPGPRLACPLTVLGGRFDPEANEDELQGWQTVCDQTFELLLFPGDHYYLRPLRRELLLEVAQRLMSPRRHPLLRSRDPPTR